MKSASPAVRRAIVLGFCNLIPSGRGGATVASRPPRSNEEEVLVAPGGKNYQLHWVSAEGLARKPPRLPFLPLRLSHLA
jgi:hypothetical protein